MPYDFTHKRKNTEYRNKKSYPLKYFHTYLSYNIIVVSVITAGIFWGVWFPVNKKWRSVITSSNKSKKNKIRLRPAFNAKTLMHSFKLCSLSWWFPHPRIGRTCVQMIHFGMQLPDNFERPAKLLPTEDDKKCYNHCCCTHEKHHLWPLWLWQAADSSS